MEKSKNEKIFVKKIIIKPENEKKISRQFRSLMTIGNKSSYVTQLKDITLNNNNSEIIFSFIDNGIDLYSLINSRVFDYRNQPNLIKWILFQILKGLETIHSLNIIHRDINPNNILISSKGEVKISGFGNSINDNESKFEKDNPIGKCNFNNKVDIWGVGVLMIELCYKKTNILKINNYDIKEWNLNRLLFNQLKFLANYFKIPFNFDENVINKKELNLWLDNAKFDDKLFKEILKDMPELEEDCLELLKRLLCFNPKERISAKDALKMPYFQCYQKFNKEEI